ncbi:MAG: hypothetical protein K2F64_03735 [Muribaculaceae bacterium]|nr:hypothetical protein [Muribaculaceae bacterium]
MIEEIKDKWQKTLSFIKDNVGEERFNTWFAVAEPLELKGNSLHIKLPSRYFFDQYDNTFFNLFRAALA